MLEGRFDGIIEGMCESSFDYGLADVSGIIPLTGLLVNRREVEDG
jgi:hypothetical protein